MNLRRLPTETQFAPTVEDLLTRFDWKWLHIRPGMTQETYVNRKGETKNFYRTPVSGDGKGFPDYLALRTCRILVAELKGEEGKTTPEQDAWLAAWAETGAEVYLWRPSDFDAILEVLR